MEENHICTKRLLLRPYEETDRESFVRILRNKEISSTFMLPDFVDDAAAEALFRKLLILSHQKDRFERAICLENNLIGFLNDVEIKDGSIELGYVIHPDYQNQGYATEALTAAIGELFRQGYSTVRAGYFSENIASGRVMEKSGMHPISRVDTIEYRGFAHQCSYYEITTPFLRLGNSILYLPASEYPLSAEVFMIQGKKNTYLFDVGNTALSLHVIQSMPNPPIAILSHFHDDHTGNALKADFQTVFVGKFTMEKLKIGTVVSEPMTIVDGITLEIIPCPSVHTPGSLILNVNREYCLIGDLFFYKPPVSSDLARQMFDTLDQVDTQYFIFSHGGTDNIFDRNSFLLELQKEFSKEESQ